MFGEFAGGAKYSFICDRGVVLKYRCLESPGRCTKQWPTHGLRYEAEELP